MTGMKPMPDKVFIDTNILIYAYSVDEPEKQAIVSRIRSDHRESAIISIQVLSEISNTLFKKFKKTALDVENVVLELTRSFRVVDFTIDTQLMAIRLKDQYCLQFYDALILATALENDCSTVISEDMQNGLVIQNQLTIRNPFN